MIIYLLVFHVISTGGFNVVGVNPVLSPGVGPTAYLSTPSYIATARTSPTAGATGFAVAGQTPTATAATILDVYGAASGMGATTGFMQQVTSPQPLAFTVSTPDIKLGWRLSECRLGDQQNLSTCDIAVRRYRGSLRDHCCLDVYPSRVTYVLSRLTYLERRSGKTVSWM
jgi:hypothetical protein